MDGWRMGKMIGRVGWMNVGVRTVLVRAATVGGGWGRRRLLTGFSMRSRLACDAAGRSVILGFFFIVVGFRMFVTR